MRIGDLAQKSGWSIRAIRYYEERGILQPAARTEGNYRLYDAQALRILKTIQRLKMLGMGLSDIAELKGIYTREGDCTNLLRERFLQMTRERIQQIDRQIEELSLLREEMGAHYQRLAEFLASQTDESLNQTCSDSLGVSSSQSHPGFKNRPAETSPRQSDLSSPAARRAFSRR